MPDKGIILLNVWPYWMFFLALGRYFGSHRANILLHIMHSSPGTMNPPKSELTLAKLCLVLVRILHSNFSQSNQKQKWQEILSISFSSATFFFLICCPILFYKIVLNPSDLSSLGCLLDSLGFSNDILEMRAQNKIIIHYF